MMVALSVNGKPVQMSIDFGELSPDDTVWALRGIIYGRLRNGTASDVRIDDLDVDLGDFAEALLADVQRAANGGR